MVETPYIDYGKMSTNGQITINKVTREDLDIEQGDMVYFRVLKVEDDMGLPKWEDVDEKKRMMRVYRGEELEDVVEDGDDNID